MDTKLFYDRAGNEYEIAPMTHARLTQAVKALKKERGISVNAADTNFDSGLEFQLALAKVALVNLSLKRGDEMTPLPGKLKEEYLINTPGAISFVTSKANKLAEDAAKIFEEESGNS